MILIWNYFALIFGDFVSEVKLAFTFSKGDKKVLAIVALVVGLLYLWGVLL